MEGAAVLEWSARRPSSMQTIATELEAEPCLTAVYSQA